MQIISSFKDADILAKALQRSGVPVDCIKVSKTPEKIYDYTGKHTRYRYQTARDDRFKDGDFAHVILPCDKSAGIHGKAAYAHGARNDIGFWCEVDPKTQSVIFVSEYETGVWPQFMKGLDGVATRDGWLKRVRAEYDCAVLEKKADTLGKPFHRVEQGGKIYAVIGA